MNQLLLFSVLLSLFSPAVSSAPESGVYSPYADRSFPERVFWGDTHMHSNRSADAYSFGNRYSADIAYRFARGETIESQGGQRVRISRPLDFLVIADHARFLGLNLLLEQRDPRFMQTGMGQRWGKFSPDQAIGKIMAEWNVSAPVDEPLSEVEASLRKEVWRSVTATADLHNQPGQFSAFIGFEWTSMPNLANLHRVVIFRDSAERAAQVQPFSVADSRDPEDLWAYLAEYEASTSGQAMAIAHNGNISNGLMFSDESLSGDPLSQGYAKSRSRWEPLYEVTQVKGDGEAHPILSPEDLFADYENWDTVVPTLGVKVEARKSRAMLAGEYARSGLLKGLVFEQRLGVNPFRFGMIGSSDIHTSLATLEEDNFFSKMPFEDPGPDRLKRKRDLFETRNYAASGLAAVWAHENTRESIFDAMRRREVYATTGPRITLRFFGGWDFDLFDHFRPDFVALGYNRGVPMGQELGPAPPDRAPRFLIVAARDPGGANLERIQLVKGWVEDNRLREKVWDVVLSDGRQPKDSMSPPIPSTVDRASATYTNTVGEVQMSTVWEDPDFDLAQRAFYYVRVLEIPTPRWTTYDAAFYGKPLPDGVPAVHQERAYSSAIWYSPDRSR